MRRRAPLFVPALALLLLPSLASAHVDGMRVDISRGPGPDEVTLVWTGGQPTYQVFRSISPSGVISPVHLIGSSDLRTWNDASGPGLIFYYELVSPCPYNPPEICDGQDNDCDGVVDGPGSELSCTLPNALPSCSGGTCVVSGCSTGFGDCDQAPTNGCETSTHMAQSTSPSIYGGVVDQDLKPGYARVPVITNCGACGIGCDDGTACTTDLCVPVGLPGGEAGACRHYDRAQCGEARCAGPLPQGTPPPLEPACSGPDADGDGLPGAWETSQIDPYTGSGAPKGIDLNCDGEISDAGGDLIWHEAPGGDSTKDVYLEYDYMEHPPQPCVGPADCLFGEPCVANMCAGHSDSPPPEAVADVVTAFSNQGMTLHVDPAHQALPHADLLYIPVGPLDSCALPGSVSLYDPAYKGNAVNFDPRRRLGYRYAMFGHFSCADSASGVQTDASGLAEVIGNDFIVSLGGFTYQAADPSVRRRENAGTLDHELGHNLGLCHGGAAEADPNNPCSGGAAVNKKPNHISVMNYQFQLAGITRAASPGTTFPPDLVLPWRPDFSHGVEPTALDESALDETVGLGIVTAPFDRDITRYFCLSRNETLLGPGTGPIDWNCDFLIDPNVGADINDSGGPAEVLAGSDEWGSLSFKFQCQPTLADGAPPPGQVAREELTLSQATTFRLRAADVVCDATHADCDQNPASGCETEVAANAGNCGGCGLACSANHVASPVCTAGTCSGACDPGFGDCNADKLTDGCETDIQSSPVSCGGCGRACSSNHMATLDCSSGTCSGACLPSFGDCNADKFIDGCEVDLLADADNCGFCGNACTPGESCVGGSCSASCPPGPANSLWSAPLSAGTPTAPTNDTEFNPAGESISYIAQGTAVYALYNSATGGHPAGSVKWSRTFPATIQNFPNPVPLSTGPEAVFVATTDGFVRGLDAETGADLSSWPSPFDTRRMSCPADQIIATPAVQLRSFSNGAFQAAHTEDLVIVITRTMCGDATNNKVYAIGASTGTLKWTFNPSISYGLGMDYGSEGGSIDYASNRIYFGTNQPSAQHTLWAINTTDGTRAWSINAGSIRNRPQQRGTRLYAATYAGQLRVYNVGNGTLVYSRAVTLATITRNPWVVSGGAFDRTIVITDTDGYLHSYIEIDVPFPTATPAPWSPTNLGGTITTMPVVSSGFGRVWVGLSDGTIHQVNLVNGLDEASATVGTTTVYDPSLDVEGAGPDVNRLEAATSMQVRRYCVPFELGTMGTH